MEDLFLIAKSWIKEESKSNYYILGVLDAFGGEFDLAWQLIKVGSAWNDELSWTRHDISYKMITPTLSGFKEIATDIAKETGDMIPEIKRRLKNEKVKTSCFKVDGDFLKMIIGEQTIAIKLFERELEISKKTIQELRDQITKLEVKTDDK